MLRGVCMCDATRSSLLPFIHLRRIVLRAMLHLERMTGLRSTDLKTLVTKHHVLEHLEFPCSDALSHEIARIYQIQS